MKIKAVVEISKPQNWDKMTKEQKLSFIQQNQDNHLRVHIVEITE